MTKQATPNFEAAFASLQQIIIQLENSELPLEEALKLLATFPRAQLA